MVKKTTNTPSVNLLDYLIIFVYLTALLAMGFLFRNQYTKEDYFLTGRSISWPPLTLSVMATQLSAISFVSAPAFVGLREGGGLIWLSYELALPLAMLLLLWRILPTLHQSGVISVYDFIERRFSRSSRIILSLVFQMSRAFATGIMIYAISVILQGTLQWPQWLSILFIGFITLIYALQGGMKAVVYGDAAQMLLIILGTLLCLGFGLYHIGGLDNLFALVEPDRLDTIRVDSFGISGDSFGLLPMLFGGLVLYASYYGCDQSEAQRSLSAKSVTELRYMLTAASLLRFPIVFLYCSAGLVIGTLAVNTPSFLAQIPTDKPDWMMPIFIINYLPNGMIGLLVVAILAAAMSSLSSAINSLAAVSLEDFQRYRQTSLSDKQYTAKAKLASLTWSLITLALAFFAGDIAPTVIEAINKVGSIFYGPMLAVFALAVMSNKVQALHINIALPVGVITNLLIAQFAPNIFWFWWNLTGFIACIGCAWAACLLMPIDIGKPYSHISALTKPTIFILVGWFTFIFAVLIGLQVS